MHLLRFWLLLSAATVAAVSQLPSQPALFSTQAGLEEPDLETALLEAQNGITKRPESVRLRLMEADILERLGRHYLRRRKLQEAAAALGDVRLLRQLAETEDLFGATAPETYSRLADSLKTGKSVSDYLQALNRGLLVSLRDGNLDKAQWFADKLSDDGESEHLGLIGARAESSASTVGIPGGLAPLARIADADPTSPPERFFADYCRAIIRISAIGGSNLSTDRLERILKYFEQIARLQALGVRREDSFTLTLTISDKAGRRRSRKILNELGWKLRYSRKRVRLEPGEGASHSTRQQTASVLAIDEIGMQEALEQGRNFEFQITTESAYLLFGEEAWRTVFYGEQDFIGGFAEAVVRDVRLAKLYVGLSAMDEVAAAALVQSVGLKKLANRFADLLHLYSSAITIENDRAFVPGGKSAEQLWTNLVGARPSDPASFYLSLLKKDNGRILAFFFTLAQLDHERQRFFTLNFSRIRKFYRLFRAAPEFSRGARAMRGSSFAEFFREIPLDSQGKVQFPGGPTVWMVAKGEVSSRRLTRKLSRVAPPEVEDEVLLRLARTRFTESRIIFS